MAYSANRLEPGEFGSALNGFFLESAHMYDGLKKDPTTGLTGQTIYDYVSATPLRIGHAYANTYKHTDRSKPEDLRAYVSRDGDAPEGRFATIKFWSSVQPEQTIEALELAEQCCQAWHTLLTRHHLL